MNELQKIFDKHGADKGYKHKYHEIYEPLFKPNKNKKINFLEIGIWKGLGMASLIDYFPRGEIYGIDIFTRITPQEVPIFNNPRAHWLKGDSTRTNIMSLLDREFGVKYDYILDDGAHHPEANMLTFRHCHKFLKPGGLYIIEDVWPLERMNSNELKHPWLIRNRDNYTFAKNDLFLAELDKSGFEIERFDNRQKSKQPDSYVITLRKK